MLARYQSVYSVLVIIVLMTLHLAMPKCSKRKESAVCASKNVKMADQGVAFDRTEETEARHSYAQGLGAGLAHTLLNYTLPKAAKNNTRSNGLF